MKAATLGLGAERRSSCLSEKVARRPDPEELAIRHFGVVAYALAPRPGSSIREHGPTL